MASAGMCVTQCCHRHPPHPRWKKNTNWAELEHHSTLLSFFFFFFFTLILCVRVCVCLCMCACVSARACECACRWVYSTRVGCTLWLSVKYRYWLNCGKILKNTCLHLNMHRLLANSIPHHVRIWEKWWMHECKYWYLNICLLDC